MLRTFLLLIVIIPAAEIGILLFSGKTIGIWPTILLILFTGVLGSFLAKKQGLETIRKVQEQIRYGRLPGNELLDGVCIIAGGIFLLSPGFLTDLFGLFLLLPPTRMLFKPMLIKLFQKWMEKNTFTIIK